MHRCHTVLSGGCDVRGRGKNKSWAGPPEQAGTRTMFLTRRGGSSAHAAKTFLFLKTSERGVGGRESRRFVPLGCQRLAESEGRGGKFSRKGFFFEGDSLFGLAQYTREKWRVKS